MSGRDLLLEYAFPIQVIEPLPSPNIDYLKQVLIVAKPATGQEGNVGQIFECLNMTAVAVRTDNTNAQQCFDAGMNKVYILLADDLDLAVFLENQTGQFTLLISDDFDDADINPTAASGNATITNYANLVSGTADTIQVGDVIFTAQAGAATPGAATFQAATSNDDTASSLAIQINAHEDLDGVVTASALGGVVTITAVETGSGGNSIELAYDDNDSNIGATVSGANLTGGDGLFVGTWGGVIGVSSDDLDFLEAQAVITRRTAFFGNSTNKAKNMFFAFGALLADRDWKNQQYIEMPFNDGIDTLAEAENLFDSKISFVINSTQYGNRLALFTNNRKAIVAPYILEYFQISVQGWGVEYIALNMPDYTIKEASLLQDDLTQKANNRFVATGMVRAITVKITLDEDEDNFVASGDLTITEPKALWRVNTKLQQV